MYGRRPYAAFQQFVLRRSADTGVREGRRGARLSAAVLHDDAAREYAYGPAQGLPATKVGIFDQSMYDFVVKQGWVIISMKTDWVRLFAFDT